MRIRSHHGHGVGRVPENLIPENLRVNYGEANRQSDYPTVKHVRISAYTNQSRVSHSVRMRENSAEEYPKQSSLERSF